MRPIAAVTPNVEKYAPSTASPAMNSVTFFSIMAPPGTPAAAVLAVQKSVADALAQPDIRQKFQDQGAEPRGWSPEQTGRFVQAESERWNKVIKSAKVTLE